MRKDELIRYLFFFLPTNKRTGRETASQFPFSVLRESEMVVSSNDKLTLAALVVAVIIVACPGIALVGEKTGANAAPGCP
jgi:hypothetical protein